MEKMLSETHRKYPHALRILLLIAVAAGAFWLGSAEAEACLYSYNGSYPWFFGYWCPPSTSCDDLGGEPCWTETCSKKCNNGQNQGPTRTQQYGCDNNCGQLEYCASCD